MEVSPLIDDEKIDQSIKPPISWSLLHKITLQITQSLAKCSKQTFSDVQFSSCIALMSSLIIVYVQGTALYYCNF